MLFALAVAMTAGLWLHALNQLQFRNIANFYRKGFIGLSACLAAIVWVQVLDVMNVNISQALLNGFTASFVLFVIFAWGRLTLIGLKFDATHRAIPE